jgi:hypothetical protein
MVLIAALPAIGSVDHDSLVTLSAKNQTWSRSLRQIVDGLSRHNRLQLAADHFEANL